MNTSIESNNGEMLLVISASTADELKSKILNLASLYGSNAMPTVAAVSANPAPTGEPIAETVAAKRGRKPKAETVTTAVEATIEQPSLPGVEAAAPTATKEEAMAALQKVFKDKGADAAKSILLQFGVDTFRAFPADKYGELIAAC